MTTINMTSLSGMFLFLQLLVAALTSVSSFSVPDSVHHAQLVIDTMTNHHHHLAQQLPHANKLTVALKENGFDPLSGYKELLKTNPLPTKMVTGATLAVCGDAIAQTKAADAEYDKRRAASFAAFDMCYRALQHFAFPVIVATCQGQYFGSAAMEQALASQLGIVPFLYYPAFFALTGAIQGLSIEGAWNRAVDTFVPLMKRNLLFWIPVQYVQFAYIQEDLQIPFLSVAGLAWTFIISLYAGSAKSYSPPQASVATPSELEAKKEAVVPVSSSSYANNTLVAVDSSA